MNISKNERKYRFSTLVLSIAFAFASCAYLLYVWAAESKSWDLSTAADYTVYMGDGTEDTSNTDITVDEDRGVAKLVSRVTEIHDDTAAEYVQGSFSNTQRQPYDTSLVLTKSGSTYSTSGTYTSRVLDGGTGNTWMKLSGIITSDIDMTGLKWTWYQGSSTYGSVIYPQTGWHDVQAAYQPTVIKDGETYKMWYSGQASSIVRIGYATSPDGINWTKVQGPGTYYSVIDNGPVNSFDDYNSYMPCVIKDGETYKMWYTGYAQIAGVYNCRIGYATSSDGINWTKYNGTETGGAVLDMGNTGSFDSQNVAYPCVIKDGSTYKMWYMGNDGGVWHLGYATSPDGTTWTKYTGPDVGGSIKYGGQLQCSVSNIYGISVIKDGSIYRAWLNAYGYGTGNRPGGICNRTAYAISMDGINWTEIQGPQDGGAVLATASDTTRFYNSQAGYLNVIKEDDGSFKMWFSGVRDVWSIGYATSAVDTTPTTSVRFQVRSGSTSTLSGDFVGPDGTTATYYVVDNALPPLYQVTYNTNEYGIVKNKQAQGTDLRTAGNFNKSHRYVQYKAYLYGASDGSETPMVECVAFEGLNNSVFDNTLGDYNGGTYDSVTTTVTDDDVKPFVGLAGRPGGQYHSWGTYTSRVFDGGEGADWASIAWSKGGQAIEAPEPGLVGLYHFDSNANDSSGNSNNGTWTGSALYDTSNAVLGSACFSNDGSSRYISLPKNWSLKDYNGFTATAWIYMRNPDEGGLFLTKYDSRYSQEFYCYTSKGGTYLWIKDGATGSTDYVTMYNYNLIRQWHHFAYVWDCTPGPDSIKIYIDGERIWRRGFNYNVSSQTFFNLRTFRDDSPIEIGHYYWNQEYYFKGLLDEIAIYNRPLTDAEILLQYRKAAPIRFQCRSAASTAELAAADFVGPDGTANTYYTTASGSSFGDEVANGRYFQYRAYFESGSVNTPALDSATVTYNTSSTFTDDTRDEFDQGTYDDSRTAFHAEQSAIVEKPITVSKQISDSADGLVLLYHMEGDLTDASGNGNDGTIYSTVNYNGNAKVGTRSAYFAGGYIDCGNLDLSGSETVEFWIFPMYYPAGAQTQYVFCDYQTGTGYGSQNTIYWDQGSMKYYHHHTDGTHCADTRSTITLQGGFNKWMHFAAVRDDTAKTVVVYTDGVPTSSGSYLGKTVVPGSVTYNDVIGRYGYYSGYYFYGLIDEVAVYDRALSADEIAEHAGVGYKTSGDVTFTSRTVDAGSTVTWSNIDWGRISSNCGEGLSATSTQIQTPADKPGLVGVWHMDGDWNDATGAYNGTPSGDATFDTTDKKMGSACGVFDGTGDSVYVGNVGSVKSVEFWVKTDSTNGGILELKNNTNYISVTTNQLLTATGITSPIFYVNGNIYSGDRLNTGWNHVVLVTDTAISTGSVNFGEAANVYLNGRLDEVALYNYALSGNEVKEHFFSQMGDNGLIALWHMDNNFNDATGNGHDGTAVGGATFSTDAKFGTHSASFDGVDDYMSFPDTNFPSKIMQRAFECWIKTSVSADQCIFHYGTTTTANAFTEFYVYIAKLTTGGAVYNTQTYGSYSAMAGAGYNRNTCYIMPLNDGKWHHIVVSAQKPSIDTNYLYFYLYVDGKFADYYYTNYSPIPNTTLTGTGRIGMSQSGTNPFNGLIDEAAVYNRIMLADEVYDHYRSGICGLDMQVSLNGGSTWTDENGNAGEYITAPPAELMLGATSQTIKYKARMSTGNFLFSPILEGVDLSKATYATDNPYVIPETGQAYLGYLTSFAQTVGDNNQGTIKYQLSSDGGSTWYWWNGSIWTTASSGYTTSNTASDINTHIDSFYEQAGAGTLKFKAFLNSDGIQPVELSQVDLGYSAGKVTVTSPNSGELLLTGSYWDITWTSAGTVGNTWTLDYSKDSGSTWTNIVTGTTVNASGGVYTYRWDPIPIASASNTARIRVTSATDPSVKDTSNADFIIGLGFEIIAANGGESWSVGSEQSIQWKSSGGMGTPVKLYYSLDSGENYTLIASDAVNAVGTNSYDWTIGSGASDDAYYSETAMLKVTNFTGTYNDESGAIFTLAGIHVTAPNGGEKAKRGGTYDITWKSAGAGASVTIEYKRTDDTEWTQITASAPNSAGTNSYTWSVASGLTLANDYKIRISGNGLSDESDSTFTVADLEVTAPNGAETWQSGTSQDITWTSSGAGTSTVTISLSTDGGSTWNAIVSGITNNEGANTYPWTVAYTLGDQMRIKVDAGSGFADSSNANFYISGVKLTAPNGGETYYMSSSNSITWQHNRAGEYGKLYYSVDNGSTYSIVTGSDGMYLGDAGAGSFSWTPSIESGIQPTARAKIKVQANSYETMTDESDAVFTIVGLRVTAPAANATWLIGSSYSVAWTSAGTGSSTANLYYSVLGDFSDQVAIATGVSNNEVYPGNNSYSWAISSSITPSTTAKVKVVAGDYNATSSTFTLKGIKVTAPALNAIVTQNAASSVTWTSAGVSGNVNIYYSSDGGSNYGADPINASEINVTTGTYSWTPNTLILTPSTNAKLKIQVVSGADTGLYAESPVFTLKGIKISAPASGTSWALGETQSITWTAAGAGGTCNIYYAPDGTNFGSAINTVPVSLSAGTYSWTIPVTTTPANGVAKIKITSDSNTSSTSYAFTMKGIKVTNPTATTVWEVGESATITWIGVGTGGTYDVYYVIDSVETKMNTTPVSGQSYGWTVAAEAASPSVIIRIKDLGPSAYIGNSQAFQIVGEATVVITSPASTDSWEVSDTNALTWTRSGTAERTFTVEYDDNIAFTSPDSISGTPAYDGAGHYTLNWSVPDSVGTRYIRVTDISNPAVTDKSDAFKIIPKFRVNTPNGGETFYALKPATTVNWGTTGTAGTVDLYYSTDYPLYETWTKINTTAITDNGSGTVEAITSYSWTVANVESEVAKIKVQAADTNLSDAYDVSDAVFTIKYYDVTWNVKSATTDEYLDKLFVIDTSGWASADLTAPVEHSYPYGTYSTTWSRTDYLDKSHRNWTTTADSMSIEISMTESSLSPEYHVMSNFSYNASGDQFLINSWVERGGIILSQPSSCTVHIYDATGGPLQTLTSSSSDTNGVFWQEWPTTNLDQDAMYFAKVDIVYSGETFSSGLSYSLNIPKSIAGLGTTVAQQLTNLQTAIGSDLAAQTTAIGAKIDTLETSIGTNLDGKISTVQADIAAVKAVVDDIDDAVGAIGGDLATPISEAVAQDLAAQLAKGIQAEILTRPTSAGFGTATDIRFRTATGMSPTITVYDANNVTRVAAAAMVEVGTTGIYEYALTPQSAWGAGEYTVVCEEPTKNAVDSMVLSVSESVATGGTDEGMVNSINATVTTIDSNVKTMLSKVNTLPDDTTDVNTSVSSLLATVGKTTDAAGTNTLFGKIASAQGDITAFKSDITSYVDGVETTLGTTADAAGTNTVYGKIKSLEQTLSALGPDGKKASKELLAAKDQAAAASKAADDIKKMIAAGGKNAEAYAALQKLASGLAKLQAANANIGGSVTADSITDFIRETRAKLAQVAMKEGYENLVPETGEVGQVNLTEEEDVEDLRNNMTELKALLSQVRSLLDKQVNAPVVKSWIEGK